MGLFDLSRPDSLPIAVPNLPHNPQNRMVWDPSELPEQVCEEGCPSNDDLLQILGDLPRHGEQEIGILADVLGNPSDSCLGRRDVTSRSILLK